MTIERNYMKDVLDFIKSASAQLVELVQHRDKNIECARQEHQILDQNTQPGIEACGGGF